MTGKGSSKEARVCPELESFWRGWRDSWKAGLSFLDRNAERALLNDAGEIRPSTGDKLSQEKSMLHCMAALHPTT
jgi:hypothetical protein